MALPTAGLSLCSGIGGLDLALEHTCPGYRTVVYVEREAYAASTLVARMADSSLAQAPIWDDLSTFDGRPWRGRVDIVTAGFPCQPFSVAGSRKGTADDRWIWPDIARILGEVRPRYVFLENVRGFLGPSQRNAVAAVLGTLADLGFDAEWGVFRASDVGAPHRRERWFLLGHTERDPWRERPHEPLAAPAQHTGPGAGSDPLADAGREREDGPQHGRTEPDRPTTPNPRGARQHLANASGERCDRWRQPEREQHESPQGHEPVRSRDHWLQQQWPPGPNVPPDRWPEGTPQPSIRGDADGLSNRVDRLRTLGNSVVPQQAALAFEILHGRLTLAGQRSPC